MFTGGMIEASTDTSSEESVHGSDSKESGSKTKESDERLAEEYERLSELIRREISEEDADLLVSDQLIDYILETDVEEEIAGQRGPRGVINIGVISDNFNDGDVVDIKALKAKKLLDKKYMRVKILSGGTIDKALTVKADDFSYDAIKMILLVGGKVVKIK